VLRARRIWDAPATAQRHGRSPELAQVGLARIEFMALLTTAQVAAELQVHPKRVLRLIRQGHLPAANVGSTVTHGARYRVDSKDLARFVDSTKRLAGTVRPRSEKLAGLPSSAPGHRAGHS
jgi:excisionase family DNA binding protein